MYPDAPPLQAMVRLVPQEGYAVTPPPPAGPVPTAMPGPRYPVGQPGS